MADRSDCSPVRRYRCSRRRRSRSIPIQAGRSLHSVKYKKDSTCIFFTTLFVFSTDRLTFSFINSKYSSTLLTPSVVTGDCISRKTCRYVHRTTVKQGGVRYFWEMSRAVCVIEATVPLLQSGFRPIYATETAVLRLIPSDVLILAMWLRSSVDMSAADGRPFHFVTAPAVDIWPQ